MDELEIISPVLTMIWVLVGIIISMVLPIAVKTLQGAWTRPERKERPTLWERIVAIWKRYNGERYLWILLAALVVAVVLVFLLGLEFYTSRDAALSGFAWESLINKLFAKQQPDDGNGDGDGEGGG